MQKLFLLALCCLFALGAFSQSDFRAFAGAGYGLENRIGFHGVTVQGGGQWAFGDHLSGIASLAFFYGNRVPKWGEMENAGAYFRQLTPPSGCNTTAVLCQVPVCSCPQGSV